MKKKTGISMVTNILMAVSIWFLVSGCSNSGFGKDSAEELYQEQDFYEDQKMQEDQEEDLDYALKIIEMDQKETDKTTKKISDFMEVCRPLYCTYKPDKAAGEAEEFAGEIALEEELVHQMIEAAAAKGYSVICGSRDYNMTNYEKADEALRKAQAGEDAEVEFYQINTVGIFRYYRLKFHKKDLTVTFTSAVYHQSSDGSMEIDIQQMEKIQAYRWEYTKKGWLIWEKALTRNQEMDMHVFYRILPLDELCRDVMEHYIVPVSYLSNNLFLEDWNEGSMEKIEFNDLFDYLYRMAMGKEIEEEDYPDGIPKEEFERIVRQYFDISAERLEQCAGYDGTTGKYPWTVIKALNRVQQIQPFPEVVRCVENEDGTLEAYVEAIYTEEGTDYAFGHVVTFRKKEDGRMVYIGNQVDRENVRLMPAYKSRKEFANDESRQ